MPAFRSKAQMFKFKNDPKLQQYFVDWLRDTPAPHLLPEKVASEILKIATGVIIRHGEPILKRGLNGHAMVKELMKSAEDFETPTIDLKKTPVVDNDSTRKIVGKAKTPPKANYNPYASKSKIAVKKPSIHKALKRYEGNIIQAYGDPKAMDLHKFKGAARDDKLRALLKENAVPESVQDILVRESRATGQPQSVINAGRKAKRAKTRLRYNEVRQKAPKLGETYKPWIKGGSKRLTSAASPKLNYVEIGANTPGAMSGPQKQWLRNKGLTGVNPARINQSRGVTATQNAVKRNLANKVTYGSLVGAAGGSLASTLFATHGAAADRAKAQGVQTRDLPWAYRKEKQWRESSNPGKVLGSVPMSLLAGVKTMLSGKSSGYVPGAGRQAERIMDRRARGTQTKATNLEVPGHEKKNAPWGAQPGAPADDRLQNYLNTHTSFGTKK